MKYTRKNKKLLKNKKHTKKNYKRKNRGGGCGCTKLYGGSSGPSNLAQLSSATYSPYYNVTQDPNNTMISTSTPSNNYKGGSRKGGSRKKGSTKKYKQIGGISGQDMVSSMFSSPNTVASYLTGSNTVSNPGFLANNLSTNQPSSFLPNTSPGISYLV